MFQLILGAAVIVAITLGIFTLVMFPPMQDIANLALYLSLTALVSAVIGYLAYSLGWIHMSPTLRWTLLGGYILASVLTFFNVWFSAQMMFSSQHDLLLAIVLLVFAGGMATVLGYFLSGTITQRIHLLKNAAENIAHGELNTRVPVQGHDEVAGLAKTVNQMAEQ